MNDSDKIAWQKVELGQYIDIVRGVSYASSELKTKPESISLVNLKNVNRGGGFRPDGLKDYVGKYKPDQQVVENDLIVAVTDLTPGAEVVGMPALIPKLAKPACISMDVVKLKFKNNSLDKKFLYYLLSGRSYKGWIRGFANGINVLHLNSEGITKFKVAIPKSTEE